MIDVGLLSVPCSGWADFVECLSGSSDDAALLDVARDPFVEVAELELCLCAGGR